VSDGSEVVAGLTLEQYAGVVAAIAEKIPLADVLLQEGVDDAAWADAERAWRQMIAGAPDLQLRFAALRREAEDCLMREVEPLATDAVAWAGLLGALATARDPQKLIDGLGLTMSDVARIGRGWQERAAKDPKIADRLTELAGKAPVPAAVRAAAVKLKPFRWTKRGTAKADATFGGRGGARLSTPQGGVLPAESDVDLYAALCAVRQLAPDSWAQALALCGLHAWRWNSVEVAWEQRLAADPDLRATHLLALGDHRAALQHLLAGAQGALAEGVAE
jgi:hypothetical protein